VSFGKTAVSTLQRLCKGQLHVFSFCCVARASGLGGCRHRDKGADDDTRRRPAAAAAGGMLLTEALFCATLTWCTAAWWISTWEGTADGHKMQFAALQCYVVCTAALLVWACTSRGTPRWQLLPALMAYAVVTTTSTDMIGRCCRRYRLSLILVEGDTLCTDDNPSTAWQLRCMYATSMALTALSALLLHQLPLPQFPRVPALWWKFRHVGLVRDELELSDAQVRPPPPHLLLPTVHDSPSLVVA
jgi:hypothetical protein